MRIQKEETMADPIADFWKLRLEETKEASEKNNFEVFIAASGEDA